MKYLILLLFIGVCFGQINKSYTIQNGAKIWKLPEAPTLKEGDRVFTSLNNDGVYRIHLVESEGFGNGYIVKEITKKTKAEINLKKEINKLWKAYAKLKKQNKQKPKRKPNAVYLNLDKMNNPRYMLTWYLAGEADTIKVPRLTYTGLIYWQKNDTLYKYIPKP